MRLQTTQHLHADAVVVHVRGRLRPGATEIRFWDEIKDVLARGHRHIAIDVAEASCSDASAISTLLGALFVAQDAGGTVKLINVTRGFDDLQTIVALYDHFDCYDSEQEALESFGVYADAPTAPAVAAAQVA